MQQFESLIGVNPWTAIFVLINTLLIFAVAKKYLFVPVHNMIEQRQQEIKDPAKAADWYRKAIETGEPEAVERARQLLEDIENV